MIAQPKILNYFTPGADYAVELVAAFWSIHSVAAHMSFGAFCDFLKTIGGVRLI